MTLGRGSCRQQLQAAQHSQRFEESGTNPAGESARRAFARLPTKEKDEMSFTRANSMTTALALLTGVAGLGCGTTQPPKELLDARTAYRDAQKGRASALDPAGLHVAKVELDKAEHAFNEDGDSRRVKDMAYVAQRRAELAEVNGETAYKQNQLEVKKQEQKQALTERSQQQQAALEKTKDQLAREQAAREQAEKRAQDAMDKLAAANTKVRKEPRGTIITLPGTVLFKSGEAQLLPSAQAKLSEVVTALKDQENAQIEVQGHTDSQGGYELNMELSKRRAQSVADYLASQGIARDHITANGYGATQPIADNSTSAGRADNRRVEIVVKQGSS